MLGAIRNLFNRSVNVNNETGRAHSVDQIATISGSPEMVITNTSQGTHRESLTSNNALATRSHTDTSTLNVVEVASGKPATLEFKACDIVTAQEIDTCHMDVLRYMAFKKLKPNDFYLIHAMDKTSNKTTTCIASKSEIYALKQIQLRITTTESVREAAAKKLVITRTDFYQQGSRVTSALIAGSQTDLSTLSVVEVASGRPATLEFKACDILCAEEINQDNEDAFRYITSKDLDPADFFIVHSKDAISGEQVLCVASKSALFALKQIRLKIKTRES